MCQVLAIFLINCLLFMQIPAHEHCESDWQSNECGKGIANFYNEVDNKLMKKINKAANSYKLCIQSNNCSCYSSVLKNDLKPFATGIEKDMIDSIADLGTKYAIIDHKMYRQKRCMFPARCLGIEHFIKPLLSELPNMEMIINTRDWPQINAKFGKKAPILSFSKTTDYLDIMYPAWSFWEGGPAIKLYPTGIGRWDKHRESIAKAAENWPWSRKLNKVFFRGSRTSEERDSLVLLSRRNPNLFDAQYTKNQAWKSPKDTLNAEPASEVNFEEHCQYKYLFNFRGVAASFRFKHLFLCKSLVFHVGNEWQEFFYESLQPWVHYVEIPSQPTESDLEKIIEFFEENDGLAQQIADRGFQHIWNNLRLHEVQCYWRKLLLKYGRLVKYNVTLDESLIELD